MRGSCESPRSAHRREPNTQNIEPRNTKATATEILNPKTLKIPETQSLNPETLKSEGSNLEDLADAGLV